MFAFGLLGNHGDMPSKPPKPCKLRKIFGRNLAKLRRDRGLTQEQLAEAVGLSTRYIQSIEAGEYWPQLPVLVEVRKTLNAKWDDLLAGCGK